MRWFPVFLVTLTCCTASLQAQAPPPGLIPEVDPLSVPPEVVQPPQDLVDYPFRPAPGWFVGLEGAIYHGQLSSTDLLSDAPEPVSNLGTTVSPCLTLGYHFQDGNALLGSYRFLTNSASAGDFANGQNQVRATFHVADLDYQGCVHGPWLGFTSQWQTGIRLVGALYDIHQDDPTISSQQSQRFLGAGPHVGLNLAWWFPKHIGLGLFGRADVGLALGSLSQSATDHYNPQPNVVYFPGPPPDSTFSASAFKGILTARVEVGLSWVLPTSRWMRLETGCQVEDFTYGGNSFNYAGPFLRYEVGF